MAMEHLDSQINNSWPLLLTVEETAQILRVTVWHVYELVRKQELPSIRVGRAIRIPRDQLFQHLGIACPVAPQ